MIKNLFSDQVLFKKKIYIHIFFNQRFNVFAQSALKIIIFWSLWVECTNKDLISAN